MGKTKWVINITRFGTLENIKSIYMGSVPLIQRIYFIYKEINNLKKTVPGTQLGLITWYGRVIQQPFRFVTVFLI